MNIDLDLYKIFYIVAMNGSISAASNILYISQPAVTVQIKKLENILGVSLFTRTKKGMVLTDEGKVLYDYVKSGIESINNGENALSNLKNLDNGNIRIGVSTTICRYILMPYIEKFHKCYPNIDIQIDNDVSKNLLKELRNGNLDIVVMFKPLNENKDLNIISFDQVQDIFVGNKKYNDIFKKNNSLNNLPFILPKSSSSSRIFLDKFLKENNIPIKPKLEVVSYSLIVDLVKAGFGVGYVTKEFIQNELNNKSLYEIKLIKSIPKRSIAIVTIDKKEPNFSTKKLIELIKNKNI